jgi:HK97 family phage portal protein
MGILDRIFSWNGSSEPIRTSGAPRALITDSSGGIEIRTPQELEEALRHGAITSSGTTVNADTAMRVATVFGCIRLISGAIATLPLQIKRRVDDRTRLDATDAAIWRVLNRRPNKWQKPAMFKRMMQAHLLLRGNAYAHKTVNAKGEVIALIPLHPDRVECRQRKDMGLEYEWTRKDGVRVIFAQHEILHLVGLTFDGYRGVSPLTYAREAIGLAIAQEDHGASVFKNGANVSGALKHKNKLSTEAHDRLKASMDQFRTGGARDGQTIILEEGMEFDRMALSSSDRDWETP